MEKYSKYKDSGIEWLGNIPEDWRNYRVDWVSTIVRGNTGLKKDELLNKGDYVALQYGKTYKVDEVNNAFNFYVNSELYKKSQVVHYGNTILISTSETIEDLGHSCFYNRFDLGLLGGEQILLKPDSKQVIEKYLYYYSKFFCLELRKYATGLKVFRFNNDDLKNIFILIPPLKEQTQIANYLDAKTTAIDKKVNLLQQKIKHYKAYRKTLINETVIKGLDKTVKLKDSGIDWIGEIPEHWEVKRYKSFGKTIKGKNMEMSDLKFDNSLPLLSLEYLRNDSVKHPTFCYSKDKSLKSTDEDLVIVWDGAAVGEILKSKVGYVSSTIAKLDINKKKFNTRYFYHLRGAIDYKLKQIPTGMGIPHLNPTLFKNFKCPAPPIKEQQQIADYLDAKTATIDRIVKNIGTQITTLKELRKTLINEVVTGKVKVSA
ncbi:restriction endonuclease subunit S [Tenacibaculum aestuariivivum]|uniref:restriction endonuclease subunit S n=1 Tax=Tenacibaculum aestuariivivum TaxID=2006131 RepID=UPI003AB49A2B